MAKNKLQTPVESGTFCDADKMITLMRAGDIQALDHMTRCFGRRLLDVGRRYCRTETEAEDAMQDALLAAGKHLQNFRAEGSIEGWLVRMVTNACHHLRRGRKNNPVLHDAGAVLLSSNHSPEQAAQAGQLSMALGDALLSLTPDDRTIVLLAEAEGWTGPEIAEKLELSAGAVRVRLSRARAKLREKLEAALDVKDVLEQR
ncbi:MAG: sigma-70 family RNA polymerase sigma factor [Deltaproteobacteria bacterium]|nr:sigma-70 family RNA polymerase sigma factor [Deltaproteobacteria bacterium]